MAKEIGELEEFELSEDERVLLDGIPELSELGETRRRFLKQATAMGLGVAALNVLASEDIFAGGDFVEDAFAFVPADENAVTKPIGIPAAS